MIGYLIDKLFIKQPGFRAWVTRMLWRDRDGYVPLFGASLFANTIKENGYHRAARLARRSSLWRDEAPVLLNIALVLRDGDTVVDIGANVGLFIATLARSRFVHRRMRFYAFEANPDTCARLARTVADLPVAVRNIALSDRAGTRRFVGGAVSHVFTTIEHASAYNFRSGGQEIACARLDELPIEGDSLVLKIDVEGQEREVLDGASGLFAAGRIGAVYLDGYADPSALELLRARDFRLLDGRTLVESERPPFSVLALSGSRLRT